MSGPEHVVRLLHAEYQNVALFFFLKEYSVLLPVFYLRIITKFNLKPSAGIWNQSRLVAACRNIERVRRIAPLISHFFIPLVVFENPLDDLKRKKIETNLVVDSE